MKRNFSTIYINKVENSHFHTSKVLEKVIKQSEVRILIIIKKKKKIMKIQLLFAYHYKNEIFIYYYFNYRIYILKHLKMEIEMKV